MWARAVRVGFLKEAVGGSRSLLSPRPCSLVSADLHNNLPQLLSCVTGEDTQAGRGGLQPMVIHLG